MSSVRTSKLIKLPSMTTTIRSISKAFEYRSFSQGIINSYIWPKFRFVFAMLEHSILWIGGFRKKSVFIPDSIQIIPRKFYSIPKKAFFIPRSRRKNVESIFKNPSFSALTRNIYTRPKVGFDSTLNKDAGYWFFGWIEKSLFSTDSTKILKAFFRFVYRFVVPNRI